MSRIRLIATDLDGTLLRRDGTISARTCAAIRSAENAGLIVAFVSARPPRSIAWIARELGINGLAICANGAILYDIAKDEVLSHKRLPNGLARELVLTLRTQEPAISFATEHGHMMGYEAAFPRDEEFIDPHPSRVDHAHQLCAEDITKLMVYHPRQSPETLAAVVRIHTGQRASVTHSGGRFVEVGAGGVSKATGLATLCRRLDIGSHEVIAFGDMPNDLPMLTFAGRGVAVANAHPEVIAAADEVTTSNDEDGVARTIERLLT
jgi:Cof subfamily protein (haloacid dehalogenase superfamily)